MRAVSLIGMKPLPKNYTISKEAQQAREQILSALRQKTGYDKMSPEQKRFFDQHANMIQVRETILESEYDPASNYFRTMELYKKIYQLLAAQMGRTKSFKDTIKIIKRKFIENKDLTDQSAIDECFAQAEEYLHRLNARSLINEKPETDFKRDNLTDKERIQRDEKETEFGQKTLESSPEYWNQYYQQEGSFDEFFCSYEDLKPYLEPICNENSKVLVVGCGLSSLGTNIRATSRSEVFEIDNAEFVVKYMKHIHKDIRGLNYDLMDVRDLKFPQDTFDVIVDKVCLDTILDADGEELENVTKMEESVWRVLKPGGIYFLVTAVPLDGMSSIFSQEWMITKVGYYDLNAKQVVDGVSEEEKSEDYETNMEDELLNPKAHFYKLVKHVE
jgi:2-polyprenyl-3-methyl-5-hydroxy-6-metoxy-1,4-benzoquinol methylase